MTHPRPDESNAPPATAFTAHVHAAHVTGMFRVDEGMTVLSLSVNEGESTHPLSLVLGGNAVLLDTKLALDLLQWLEQQRPLLVLMRDEAVAEAREEQNRTAHQKQAARGDSPENEP